MDTPNMSIYSDALKVYFNYDNFSLDFLSKEDGNIHFLGRVKLSPQSAKELKKSLDWNIKKYESVYGKINNYDEKAKEKEDAARKEMLEEQNNKLETECEKLERYIEENAKKYQALRTQADELK